MRVNPLPFEVLLEVEQCPGQISGEKQLSERNFSTSGHTFVLGKAGLVNARE